MHRVKLIRKPTRREMLKYAGVGALAFGVPLLLKVRPALAAITVVHTGNPNQGTSSTPSLSIASTSQGNGLIIWLAFTPVIGIAGAAVAGETINNGISANRTAFQEYRIYCVRSLQSSGTKNFTASTSYDAWMGRMIEITGHDTGAAYDVTNSAQGDGTVANAQLTTTVNNCAMFSLAGIANYHSGLPLEGDAGFTMLGLGNVASPAMTVTAMYKLDAGAAGTHNNNIYTGGSESWLELAAAVKPAGGAPAAAAKRHGKIF